MEGESLNEVVYDEFAKLGWGRSGGDHDPFGQGVGMVWPYGKENWCNLEG